MSQASLVLLVLQVSQVSTGLPGATGAAGIDGSPGATGAPGLPGVTGSPGSHGVTGSPGSHGVTGAQGLAGTTGTFDYNNNNNTPPSLFFGDPYRTSTNIFIPITYPSQTYVSSFLQPLPTILGSIFDISYNTVSGVTGTRILNTTKSPFNYQYVKPLATDANFDNFTYPLEGIIISKNNNSNNTMPTPSIQTFINNNGSTGVWSIKYNISNISSGNTGNNRITGSYKNYTGTLNPSTLEFGTFSSGTAPTPDASYISVIQTFNTITLTIKAPSLANTDSDPDNTMASYTCGYSTPGSTIRYNSQISNSGSSTVTYTEPSQTQIFTGLYPDSSYTFTLQSTNKLGLSSTTTFTGDTNKFSTSYLSPSISTNITNASYSFSPTRIPTAYFVSDTNKGSPSSTTNLINNVSNITLTTSDALSIQYDHRVRGKLPINTIMTISAALGSNSVTKSFNGFPLSSSTTTSGTITLNSGTTIDQYTTNYEQGFYSKLNGFNIVIPSSSLTASQSLNTITLTQIYNAFNSTSSTLATYTNNSNTFHYDNLSGLPTINSSTFSFSNTNSFTKVSGINVVFTNPTFTVNTDITNLFKNFFKSNLLTYTFTLGCTGTVTEANLTNCTNPIPKDGSLVTFRNSSTSATLNTSFNKSISLIVAASNFNGNTTFSPNPVINVICDVPSHLLISSSLKNPISINSVSSTATTGYRVWSAPGTLFSISTYMPPMYGYNNDAISYTKFKYDHSWNLKSSNENSITINGTTYSNIDASQELQIFNGYYQSIGSGSYTTGINNTNVVGYTNYSSYNNNTLDYSVPVNDLLNDTTTKTSNYRFATFVWDYNNSATTNTFIFTLKNFKYNGSTPSIIQDADGVSYLVSGTSGFKNRIFLHYRVEHYVDANNIYISPKQSNSSTVWVDGNSTKGTISGSLGDDINTPAQINSGNYYDNESNKTVVRAPGSLSYSISGSDLVITVSSILYIDSSRKRYIYCRIGLPMNANYAFEYVTLKI